MRRHLFWILEVFLWLLILVSVSSVFIITKHQNQKINSYQIFLPDVDGLIKGSPVKYMGIQIGYVNQINIVDDKVFINFVITDKTIKLPSGVVATVEFYGLGGSKSLEIYPPKENNQKPLKMIVEQPPKRIGDSLSLLNHMYGQIVDITYSVSDFMDELDVIKQSNNNVTKSKYRFAGDFLDVVNDWFDNSQKTVDNLNKKLNKGGVNGRNGIKN